MNWISTETLTAVNCFTYVSCIVNILRFKSIKQKLPKEQVAKGRLSKEELNPIHYLCYYK